MTRPVVTAIQACAIALVSSAAFGDDLTMMVERDLSILGYDVGQADGVADVKTAIAISQFQAENGMEVSGEVSPQLAGILAAKLSNPQPAAGSAAAAPTAAYAPAAAVAPTAQQDPAALKAAQQACLQEKMQAAQAAQKKKQGFGKLLSGITKLAGQTGNYDMSQKAYDVYQAGSTADDFAQAAKDLGLTESDIEACQNPY